MLPVDKPEPGDLYAVLELSPGASDEQIRAAFVSLAAANHPDRNHGDAASLRRYEQINAAFHVLSDPGRRREYDAQRDSVDVDFAESVRSRNRPESTEADNVHWPAVAPLQQSWQPAPAHNWNADASRIVLNKSLCPGCGQPLVANALRCFCGRFIAPHERPTTAYDDSHLWRADEYGAWHHPVRGSWANDGPAGWRNISPSAAQPRSSSFGCGTVFVLAVLLAVLYGGCTLIVESPVVALAIFFVGIPFVSFVVWLGFQMLGRRNGA